MGKGGTKFIGESVSSRRKAPGGETSKSMRRNLDKFLETGVHPEIERMRQEHANQLPSLPEFDVHRPFVFLDISVGGKPLGRLVIELFEDMVPVAASHFRNRCMPGSSGGLAGTCFHKLLSRYALHGGLNTRGTEGVRLQSNTQLRAVEGGVVAVALTGEDFAIALDRALDLDRTHQVVGRVHKGHELLAGLGDLRTLPDDSPAQRVLVVRAGATNHLGTHEDLNDAAAAGGSGGGPPKDMAARLQEASAEARTAVMEALSEGLKRKRRPDAAGDGAADGAAAAAGPSTSGRPPAAAGGSGGGTEGPAKAGGSGSGPTRGSAAQQQAAAAAAARSVKARMLDSMLGDLEDEDSSSSGGDGDEGS